MTPGGGFSPALATDHRKHYGAVAGGSGITPLMSIVRTILALEPFSRVMLIYSNRTRESVMFWADLEDLVARYPGRLRVQHVLTREVHGTAWGTRPDITVGRIECAHLLEPYVTLGVEDPIDEWFLCAPGAFIEEVTGTLVRHGVDPGAIHRELFTTEHLDEGTDDDLESRKVPSVTSQVTVVAGGRRSEFTLATEAESILRAALAVAPDLPYACEGGICGTCRARVDEGRVVMDRRAALDQEEVTAGYVLACQSHPVTERVVLNFDF